MSLLDAARTRPQREPSCWRQHLPPQADDELRQVEQIHVDGGYVNRSAIGRALREEYGINLGKDAVARHFRYECICDWPDPSG